MRQQQDKFILCCDSCRTTFRPASGVYSCPVCGGRLAIRFLDAYSSGETSNLHHRGMWKYFGRLPLVEERHIVTLSEGATPLVKLCEENDVYLKMETLNPTGTYKDRPASLGVSRALELEASGVVVASDANTGPAVAAYAARGRLKCAVVMPKMTPKLRYLQALAYGAEVILVAGSVNDCLDTVRVIAHERGFHNCSTAGPVNPYQLEANRTIAYEIVEELGDAPDWVALPVGGGGLVVGTHAGFQDMFDSGAISHVPKLLGVQVASCAPLVLAFNEHKKIERWTKTVDTVAFPIAVPLPPDGDLALECLRCTGGFALSVDEDEVKASVTHLSLKHGILAEPAGAVSFAGLQRAFRMGMIDKHEHCVAVITGTGLKSLDLFEVLELGVKSTSSGEPQHAPTELEQN